MENFDNNKKERQVDNLINLVENHTRTERHLEQYSDIGDKGNKEHARNVQDDREEQIEILKDKITGNEEKRTREKQLRNLEQKYESTEGYLKNNVRDMNHEDLKNMEIKQENRKNQINNLK